MDFQVVIPTEALEVVLLECNPAIPNVVFEKKPATLSLFMLKSFGWRS